MPKSLLQQQGGLPRVKKAFLDAFVETARINKACKAIGIEKHRHYEWLRDDAQYVQDFERAKEAAIDTIEDRARELAFDGDSRLCLALLNAYRPERFRYYQRFEHTGPNGQPLASPQTNVTVNLNLAELSDDQLSRYSDLLALLRSRAGARAVPGGNGDPPTPAL